MYYFYLLKSLKDDKLYAGFTADLRRRIREHETGKNVSTKSRRPLRLLYYEAHSSEKDARRREHYFKSERGKSSLKQMLRDALQQKQGGKNE